MHIEGREAMDESSNENGLGLLWRKCSDTILSYSQFKRDGMLLAGSTVLAQVIGVVSTPILGRLYSPSAFGVWGLLQGAAGLLVALGGLRYELAFTLSENDKEAANVAGLQMSCLLLTTLLTAIAVFFWGGPIAAIVGIGQYQNWMLVLPAIVFITTFTIGANYWNIRNGEFRHLAQYRVTQSLAVAAAQGVAWRFSSGPAGLIVGGVLGLCAPAIVFLIGFWKKYRRLMRSISLGGMWQAARKFSNFPRYTVPWGFAAIARERGIILLLGMYATTDIVGLYTIALRLSYLPFQLIASSVSPIVYRRACEYSTVSAAAPMVYRVLKTIITYMTPASIIIGWFARDAFTVLMGHQWGKAGFYACLLAIPGSLQVLSVPLERLLDIASCQRVALIIETCYSLTVVSLTALVLASGKGVPIAIGLFAAVTAFYHVALLCAVYRFCCFPMRDLAMLAGRYIAFAGGTAFVLFLTTTNHPWVELMVSRK